MEPRRTDPLHKAIDLIYETAIEPGKWPELLHALAAFSEDQLDREQSLSILSEESPPLGEQLKPPEEAFTLSSALTQITHPREGPLEKTSRPESSRRTVNRILLGHFKRAIQIAKRLIDLEAQHEGVVSLLDHLPIALFVVGQSAEILEANHQASRMLGDKRHFRSRAGKLVSASGRGTNKLHQAIRKVLGKEAPRKGNVMRQGLAVVLEGPDEQEASDFQEDLMLFLSPISQNQPEEKPRVAVFVSSRSLQPLVIPEQVFHFYGLTAKERAVTTALVQGQSIKQIALKAKLSEHTVRSQVKSVLRKTGSARQTDLVRLMLRGASSLMPTPAEEEKNRFKAPESHLLPKQHSLPDAPKVFFLADGRRMAYREYGDPLGEPVFHCHSLLGSRLELAFEGDRHAKAQGIRLIIPDRPGIGCSDPRSDAGFLEWAEDLKALADGLEIGRFKLSGYAMGGQYALAAAFAMPRRIRRLALVSVGFAPRFPADFREIQTFYRFNLKLVKHARPIYRLFFSIMRRGFLHNPDNFFKQFSGQMEGRDLAVLEAPNFRGMLTQNLYEGWRQSALIPCRDIESWMDNSWDFYVQDIQTPVDLWHGERDHHVPCILGQALARRLPNVRLRIEASQGHLMFFSHWPKMLEALRRF